MLFGKKQEILGDQLAVYQNREAPRFAAAAGITLEGFEGEGLLKNISISGCCLESVTYVSINPGQIYQAKLIPANVNIKPFTIKFAANWTRSSEKSFEAGFSLDPDKTDPRLEHYVQLLQAQGVQPEYGNMRQSPAGKN